MGLPEDWEEGRLDVLAVEIEIITVDYRCNKLAVSMSVYRGKVQCTWPWNSSDVLFRG